MKIYMEMNGIMYDFIPVISITEPSKILYRYARKVSV